MPLQHVNASATGRLSSDPRPPLVAFTERQQIVAARANRHQTFKSAISAFKGNINPTPTFVPKLLIELFDDCLERPVRMFLCLDERIEAAQLGTVGDVFVALALTQTTEPDVIGRTRSETRTNLRKTANVVENDDALPILYDDTACFENTAGLGRGQKFNELAFTNQMKTVRPTWHQVNDNARVRRRTAIAAVVYALAACAFTWPLALHLQSAFGATDPTGDPSLNLWTLGWDLRTLFAHPVWFLNGRVFNAPIFFPAPLTLAYSDHLLLQSLIAAPVYAVSHDLVLCYNLLLLASLTASALAMHALVRELNGGEPAAFVSGLIFGFAPYHFTHLVHLQLQALYFLPLSFLFLHRVINMRGRFDAIALGIVTGLQAISSVYYGVIGLIGLTIAAVLLIVIGRRWRDWRLLRAFAVAAIVATLIALPWSVAYVRVMGEAGGGRNLYESAHSSATLTSQLQVPETNLLYGRTNLFRPGGILHLRFKDGPEQGLFIGFVPLVLALIGLTASRRESRTVTLTYAVLALVGVVLSLGPEGVRPLYAFLYRSVFGMSAIRAAARFDVLTILGISVLAGSAIQRLAASGTATTSTISAVACGLIAIEYCNGAIVFPATPLLTSNAGRWLHDQPGSGAVLCVPLGAFATNTPCMLQQLEHGRPIVNGYSGLRPPFFEALMDQMDRLPSDDSIQALHDLGIEYVVSTGALPPGDNSGALVERAAFSDQRVYQLVWSPELESRLNAASDVSPPEPGTPPFVVGESATYHVRWTSGPMRISAGDATIAIAPPQGTERYRFVVSAKTAPWMASFFDTDVHLETAASERFLPLTYHERISDGKRRTERLLTFDAAKRQMKVVSGGTTVTMPFGREARDPISALFYVRTLPLTSGSRATIPLNDSGRRMRLDVMVDRQETITIGDRSWPSWRIEPRVTEAINTRSAPRIVAWLSADAHRIPLVVEVSAGFGSARLELADYREK